jgi:hypothetical protein
VSVWEVFVVFRVRLFGVLVLGVLLFGGVGVVVARAEGPASGPYWSIEGTRLAAGKTFEITAKATTSQTLSAGTDVVTCTGFKLKPGAVLLGSNGVNPGRSDLAIEYNGCTVSGNGTGCAVENGTITTFPLTTELGYAENERSLVVEFDPAAGKKLFTLKFKAETGGTCTLSETQATGLVVAGVFTDVGGAAGELLELGKAVTQAESWILKSPAAGASTFIWLVSEEKDKKFEYEKFEWFSKSATYEGTALVLLAVHGTSVATKWSPLL